MLIEANKISIRIYNSFSLKDKRSVVKSIVNKVHNKFNVSISEVDDHDMLNKATFGIATVSNNHLFNEQVFDNIYKFIEESYEVEIISIENFTI